MAPFLHVGINQLFVQKYTKISEPTKTLTYFSVIYLIDEESRH
jgi:hypothetical protein